MVQKHAAWFRSIWVGPGAQSEANLSPENPAGRGLNPALEGFSGSASGLEPTGAALPTVCRTVAGGTHSWGTGEGAPPKHGLNQHAGKAKKNWSRDCGTDTVLHSLPASSSFLPLPPSPPVQHAPPSPTFPKGASLLFTVHPLPVGRFSRWIPARLASLSTTSRPKPNRVQLIIPSSPPAVVWLTSIANRSPTSRALHLCPQ